MLETVSVVYLRLQNNGRHDPLLPAGTEALIDKVQKEMHISYTNTRYTGDSTDINNHRLRLPCETSTYETTGLAPAGKYFRLKELRENKLADLEADAYHQTATSGEGVKKRLIEKSRVLYFDDDLQNPLPLGTINHLGLVYETYTLALTDGLLNEVFGEKINAARTDLEDENKSGYLTGPDLALRFPQVDTTGEYWIRSGIAGFANDAKDHFYLPEKYTDPFGKVITLQYDDKDLYIQSSTDPAGNRVEITLFDFRVLAPTQMKDINDNLSEEVFDELGMPMVMVLKGKGNEADALTGYRADSQDFFTTPYNETKSRELLGNATLRYVYDFGEKVDAQGNITYEHRPTGIATIVREQHKVQNSPLQVAFEYSDGGGKVLVKKIQAEPEPGDRKLRWIASGKTILNNKGKPVKKYEPYFCKNEQCFEEPREVGVTPIIYYDALGRVIRTRFPDGSFSRVEFTPWQVVTFDQNDTVLEPGHDWYAVKSATTALPEEQRAAKLTALHAHTPTTVFLDSLGRDVIKIEHNRFQDRTGAIKEEKYVTFTRLDAEGKPLWIRDARGNMVMQYIWPSVPDNQRNDPVDNFSPCYDIAGNLLFQHSMDSGDRWQINDAAGKPFYGWDRNERSQKNGSPAVENRISHFTYDALHRPLTHQLKINGNDWQITERFVYGEKYVGADGKIDDKATRARNLCGQLYQHYDPGGRITHQSYDFKGNLLKEEKQLITNPNAEWINWTDVNLETALNPEIFRRQSSYDALGRITRQYNWHTDPHRVAVYEPHYNERGLLKSENLTVGATKTANGYIGGKTTTPVSGITYDAKGQRQSIHHGNDTITCYHYDPLTFRLVQLRTTRPKYNPQFPGHQSNLKDHKILQQLSYTYDPVGNITEIYDGAYEPVFFYNQRVEPRNRYVYDALYHLIQAEGRESDKPVSAPGRREQQPVGVSFPVTDKTLRTYTQYYSYDQVGNILEMRHHPHGAADKGRWTRHYQYAERSNRLQRTWTGNDENNGIVYHYDTHGNMLNLGNVAKEQYIQWDHRDMILEIDRIGGGWAYYNYDSEKQRTRKTIEHQGGTVEERIYLDGMERYHRRKDGKIVEEIETHHLFVDEQRVLLVDVIVPDNTRLKTDTLYRYQYSNHLGSVGLELDEKAKTITYEEFHPFGTPAYRMKNSGIEAGPKRYRYTGMERDEETGLNYHTARYYAPWLGQWCSCDPIGLRGGLNLYQYGRNNPIILIDIRGTKPKTHKGFRFIGKSLTAKIMYEVIKKCKIIPNE